MNNDLQELSSFLEKNSIQILSTSVQGIPHSRPIGSFMLALNKIWYCMNNDKTMFQELMANPEICICVCADDFSWVRINAKAVFEDNKTIKQSYIDKAKTRFEDANDEKFSVFYLDEIQAELSIRGVKRKLEIS
ncbi:hypothetical protein DMB92_03380 [Campylobacter sp. MIT 99-7217]|uniref:pyridoxamine 5'-phosphate oxidase family protein n=1 Tax=Campylobacter sp. MIT 99-7217 TaxID=535091 RepID=UPI0011578433|nr:pyridoxamine 5'-phosphate oxidase family protein [Campylobacter sp. MIT 99-7217]TQR33014.1 hypothetical protein DMB92_03380 [Campylobacter sp. MIT 99-7217]